MDYYVWITAISSFGDDKIAATLVKRGYTVKTLARTLTSEHKGFFGVILGFQIKRENLAKDEKFNEATLLDEIDDIIKFHKLRYISLIISGKPAAGSSARWITGNIENPVTLPEEVKKIRTN